MLQPAMALRTAGSAATATHACLFGADGSVDVPRRDRQPDAVMTRRMSNGGLVRDGVGLHRRSAAQRRAARPVMRYSAPNQQVVAQFCATAAASVPLPEAVGPSTQTTGMACGSTQGEQGFEIVRKVLATHLGSSMRTARPPG